MQAQSSSPADTLSEEQQATHRLFELLKKEQILLIEASINGLDQLTQEKANVVSTMSTLGKLRYQALAAAGFPASETGMQAWLESPLAPEGAGLIWTAMLTQAQGAKEMNRTNGLLINKHMAHNQNALHALRGTAAGSGIYGPDGHSTSGTTKRNLTIS